MTMTKDTEPAQVPGSGAIQGLRIRPFELERDIAAVVDLIVEANLADGEDEIPSLADFRNELEHHAGFEMGRDMVVAELDGRLVGATRHTVRGRAGVMQHQLECWVRTTHRRRGIGRILLHRNEARARESAAEWTGSQPHRFASWAGENNAGAIVLLESEGYRPVRYGFLMVRPLADPIPNAPMPAGLEVRPVVEADHRRIWDADTEAFQDHWEAAERTEEDFVGWYGTPEIDTSMWRVAWDGDEVAGSVMNFVFPEEMARLGVRRGWLAHISVRRPWRRRGLASALIVDSLRELRARGLDEAALGVDAENPSGALGLYESLGFHRHQKGIAYRKSL